MEEMIKKMNEMFEANTCTDMGRVVVEYAPKTEIVVVKVFDQVRVINADTYTDFGLMYEVMDLVKEMYERPDDMDRRLS